MEEKCEYSKNGLCFDYCSEGELRCNGEADEQNKCMLYIGISE